MKSMNSEAKSYKIKVPLFIFFWVLFISQIFQLGNTYLLAKQSTTSQDVKGELSSSEKDMAEFAAVEKPKSTDSPGTNAIVYVGPSKTGSTTIQYIAEEIKSVLKEENYEYLNQGIGWCFRTGVDCSGDRFLAPLEKKNVLIATEGLTNPFVDYEKLRKFLDHWDNVTIVVHYRRLYEWCQSVMQQISKEKLRDGKPPHSLKANLERKGWRQNKYYWLSGAAKGYKANFDNVIFRNMHDKENNFILSLFCNDIPNAPKTCKAAQEMGVVKSNEGAIPYLQVGFYAFDEHLIEGDPSELGESFLDLGSNISNAHLKINNGNMDDFTFDCPSSSVLDDFLKESLKLEKEMFPEFFASPLGEDALRENFKEVSKAKLCDVNKTTLQNPVWKQVFKELNN